VFATLKTGNAQIYPEVEGMKLLDYDARGATLHLNGRELLMMMALIQEGRDSFECKSETGSRLDDLFSRAVVLVAQAQSGAVLEGPSSWSRETPRRAGGE
jgi:hypothetical protein